MIAESIILFSTQAEVLRYRKFLASTSPDASLGMKVTTPEALVEELWDVWGTRERLVTSSQRKMIIKKLLSEQDTWVDSLGTVDLLASFLREFVTYLDEGFRAHQASEFTSVDHEIVTFVRRYEEMLAQAGLIEGAQAFSQIASKITFPKVIVRTQHSLPPFMKQLLSCRVALYCEESAQLGTAPAEQYYADDQCAGDQSAGLVDQREYLLLKPKGQTAAAYSIFEVLKEDTSIKKCVVTSPDPQALFERMKDPLLQEGFVASAKITVSFLDTFFGRAYHAAANLCDPAQDFRSERLLHSALTYLDSPYAQLSNVQQKRATKAIRSDRALTAEALRELIRGTSRTFEYFEALVEESDADVLFGFFDELVHRLFADNALRDRELASIRCIKALYREARQFGWGVRSFIEQVNELSVPYECTFAPTDVDAPSNEPEQILPFLDASDSSYPRVLFTSFAEASHYPAGCCDLVVMADLDSLHFSGTEHRSTLTEFLERYQIPFVDDTLTYMECCFVQNAYLARSRVVFEYAEQDLAGNELYPAFFLESFLNGRVLEGRRVPERSRGEADFDHTARMIDTTSEDLSSELLVRRGVLSKQACEQLLTYAPDAQGILRPVLSPSAVETYLKCPYRWFIERKLHLDDASEQFGPREKGTFTHRVFQVFYDTWAARGYNRVSSETLEEAKTLFNEVFDRVEEEQAEERPGERYLAISELEREEIAHLKRQLLQSLVFQAAVFPTYHIEGHEVALSPDDKIVYGGAIIHGRIDRVDCDDHGNYLVIDYKGSTKDHEAGFDPDAEEDYELPEKVQTLMYAQALRRKDPRLHPRAALYLSYQAKKPKELLKGSISELLPEATTHSSKKSEVQGDFERYLDLVEVNLAKVIERITQGDIAPDPRTANACNYCPALYCEKRNHGSQ